MAAFSEGDNDFETCCKVRGGNMTGAIILSCRKLSHNIYLGISPESELPKVSTDIFNVLTTYK
jgi:hypothetical protein